MSPVKLFQMTRPFPPCVLQTIDVRSSLKVHSLVLLQPLTDLPKLRISPWLRVGVLQLSCALMFWVFGASVGTVASPELTSCFWYTKKLLWFYFKWDFPVCIRGCTSASDLLLYCLHLRCSLLHHECTCSHTKDILRVDVRHLPFHLRRLMIGGWNKPSAVDRSCFWHFPLFTDGTFRFC